MEQYIMSLDQGTTSSRCILFDMMGRVVSKAQREFKQIYPQPSWVEHSALEIWESQVDVAREAMEKIGADYHNIAAIGITNQRETTILWDKNTGKPVYNAIVWQCRRTADQCDQLKNRGLLNIFHQKTGLLIDAYFSATKIKWILDNVAEARMKADRGELLFGTVDSWLIWNLTGGKIHVTDYSNASRTMLFNIKELRWDEDILQELDIPESILPQVKPTEYIYGETDPEIFGGPIRIASSVGDQQAALFGQACFHEGMAKNTYGTGAFLLMNTGKTPVYSKNGLITTIAWCTGKEVYYALEGSIFVAGAGIQWLKDELMILNSAKESQDIAESVEDTEGVYFVPAFVGLGAPYWNPRARGMIVGLSRGTNRSHLVRATLESMAYQTFDVLKTMEDDSGIRLTELKVDGGGSNNGFLMQFQSDLIGTPVVQARDPEITALGAACLAGLAVGYWKGQNDISKNWSGARNYYPSIDTNKRDELLKGWHRAVNAVIAWSKG